MQKVETPEKAAQKDYALRESWWEATKWGFAGGIPATLVSYWAYHNNEFYRKRFSISAKVATPLMVGLFLFGFRLEKTGYLIATGQWEEKGKGPKVSKYSELPLYQRSMNYMYRNPFSVMAVAGAPLAAFILNQQLKLKHISFQQRIMHSRIYAQMGVLSLLVFVMGFKKYMDKHGEFGVDEEEGKA